MKNGSCNWQNLSETSFTFDQLVNVAKWLFSKVSKCCVLDPQERLKPAEARAQDFVGTNLRTGQGQVCQMADLHFCRLLSWPFSTQSEIEARFCKRLRTVELTYIYIYNELRWSWMVNLAKTIILSI